MNTIFETKSYRVKGISFHSKFPWVLTSLHNGEICLYDYVHGILLDKFVEHEGPVRSVNFHNSQPYFVSGGDDCKIKIWNYNTKKCQFNLTGHNDYIRTVQFHHELPWIISSSDDQTIRIWNWINRTLLTTATGHDHYVMSAFFHPSQDLIVSASLDQSIRVWDYSVLRKKFFEARSNSLEVIAMDVTLKFKIEGHDRGVNWAMFHPKLNLIASGSDDKNIKIWKFSDSKWNDADTLRGHSNNVSSVAFHPKLDILISNSEDKSIRVWDLNKKTVIDKISKESDRFWVLSTHPTQNIFASGSDSGLIVFRIENTRVPAATSLNQMVLYNEKNILMWKVGEKENKVVYETKCHPKSVKYDVGSLTLNPFLNQPQQSVNFTLSFNDAKSSIVHYYLKYEPSINKFNGVEQTLEAATSACFLSNNKVLTLTSNGSFVGYDSNNLSNKFVIESNSIVKDKLDSIYQGPLGKFIIKFKNGIIGLFDVNTKKIIQETTEMSDLKFVTWNNTMNLGALVGGNSIFIINKGMEVLSKVKENSKIKSACFDENGVLFYSTDFHVKYTLQEGGLNGIIKSTESPFYLINVANGMLYYSDSERNLLSHRFDYIDVRFKLNLLNKNYDDIVNILRSGAICGLKAIENIQNAGFPDLSLKFVNDPKQKFNLAMKSGKLEEATAAAEILKDKYYYDKLAEKAMMIGKLDIVEVCYVKSHNYDKLIFFYALTGRFDKLAKLQKILQSTGDNSRRFLNSIYTNSVDDKISALNESGRYSLAYLTAIAHDKDDFQVAITEEANKRGKEIKLNSEDIKLIKNRMGPITPLKPIINAKNREYHSNWVSLTEIKRSAGYSNIDNILSQKEEADFQVTQETETDSVFNKFIKEDKKEDTVDTKQVKINTGKWADEEEEEDEEIAKMLAEAAKKEKVAIVNITQPDNDMIVNRYMNSPIAGIQIALGNLETAFNYLKIQLGITSNYDTLKNVIKDVYMSNYAHIKFIPCVPPKEYILRQTLGESIFPQNGVNFASLKRLLTVGYNHITNAEMSEALKVFNESIKYCLFFIASNKEEEKKVKEIVYICAEYIYLARLNKLSEQLKEKDKVKYAETVCVMSSCNLENPIHKFLIYKKAKVCCKNIKNFITALSFIKKMFLLEKDLSSVFPKDYEKAHEELENYQKIGMNQHTLSYNVNENLLNVRTNFCAKTFTRIDASSKNLKCPLCSSVTKLEFKGSICETCGLCTLGEEVLGFKLTEREE